MKSVNEFILTPKDVLYLSDVLDQTLVLNKRIANETELLQNKEVKACFQNVNQKLCEHYSTLLELLKKEAK